MAQSSRRLFFHVLCLLTEKNHLIEGIATVATIA